MSFFLQCAVFLLGNFSCSNDETKFDFQRAGTIRTGGGKILVYICAQMFLLLSSAGAPSILDID